MVLLVGFYVNPDQNSGLSKLSNCPTFYRKMFTYPLTYCKFDFFNQHVENNIQLKIIYN